MGMLLGRSRDSRSNDDFQVVESSTSDVGETTTARDGDEDEDDGSSFRFLLLFSSFFRRDITAGFGGNMFTKTDIAFIILIGFVLR
jgi:hypothetical protein